jgi:transposase-like protein
MARPSSFSPEVRDRAVRMVLEQHGKYDAQWAAITSIAEKVGCTAETLRSWVRQAERDGGRRVGLTTEESVGSPKALSRRPSLPTLSPSPLPRGRLALLGGQCQRPGWGRDGQRGSERGTAAEKLALGHGSVGPAQAGSDGVGRPGPTPGARDLEEGLPHPAAPGGGRVERWPSPKRSSNSRSRGPPE